MISMPRRYLLFTLICLLPAFAQTAAEHITPGTILIASQKLADPHFAGSVILITRHDPDGGIMGVILNRPTRHDPRQSIPQMHAATDPIYDGGPVSPEAVQALLRAPEKPATAADLVVTDVYSVVRKALLEKSITDRLPAAKFRVYLGYAGWGPGQLENELRLGAWSPIRARRSPSTCSTPIHSACGNASTVRCTANSR